MPRRRHAVDHRVLSPSHCWRDVERPSAARRLPSCNSAQKCLRASSHRRPSSSGVLAARRTSARQRLPSARRRYRRTLISPAFTTLTGPRELLGRRCLRSRRRTGMIGHQEGGPRDRDRHATARAFRVHLTAGYALQVRKASAAVRTRAKPGCCHEASLSARGACLRRSSRPSPRLVTQRCRPAAARHTPAPLACAYGWREDPAEEGHGISRVAA